jgi:hypothetical protein
MHIEFVKGQRRMDLRGAFGSAAFSAACTLSLLGGGCGTAEVEEPGDFDHARLVEIVDEVTCVPLLAGKNIPAGTVCSSIDNTVDTSQQCWAGSQGVMNVTYQATGGWQLVQARMAVGTGLEDIPTNRRGKARLALYPYNSGNISGATTHTFAVPLCQLGLDASDDSCDGVLAHLSNEAELRKAKPGKPGKFEEKKGWGDGELLGRRWRQGKYYTMQLDCVSDDPPPPPVQVCETAYAHGPAATCFLGADFDGNNQDDGFSNWGWTNGPIAPNTTTTWPVYAAVGGCDPSLGEHVGNLGVTYTGGSATITFERVGDILLDEEQIHVGSQPLPRDAGGSYSINPSDYGFTIDHTAASNTIHTVHGLSGNIYVSYHAIACGDSLAPPADPLASLTDEFETNTLADWTIHRPETANVNVTDGDLVMTPNQFARWYMSDAALNVFLCQLGLTADFAKVLDFGLVRREVQQDAGVSAVLGQPGTPSYMAPEMITGTAPVDRRADVYALGCVTYWLLTGKTVFEADNPVQMMYRHAYDPPPSPSERLGSSLPPDLEALVLATLAKDPLGRPQTAEELARRLEECDTGPGWTGQQAREWWAGNLAEVRNSRS